MLNEKEVLERARLLIAWIAETKREVEKITAERVLQGRLKIQKEKERKGVASYE
jgi:hypothetical protein